MNIDITRKELVEAFGISVREVETYGLNGREVYCVFKLDGEIICKMQGNYGNIQDACSEFLKEFVKRALVNKGR